MFGDLHLQNAFERLPHKFASQVIRNGYEGTYYPAMPTSMNDDEPESTGDKSIRHP
ncbi:MAG: hypothetical protein FWH27_16915 [Planctomycetaceae bacterium]|nr:hypothetical protein [Planctomycetaceae bacterium]